MNIFQIAKALGADDLTSPTIPFSGPFGNNTPIPTGISGPSIMLRTNVVTLKKGEQAKIEIVLFTNRVEIKGFKFKIKFNPTILKVIDADPATTGTQIAYQNTFFDKITNNVSSNGEITFEAGTNLGVSTITNSVTAYFNVEAIQNGSSLIEVIKADSALSDVTGNNILQSVNSVTLNVGSEIITFTPSPTPTLNPSIVTPRTGLIDDLGYTNAVIIGALLIMSGIYLFKKKDSHDLH